MRKKYSIFITVLFCLFIFGFGIALLVLGFLVSVTFYRCPHCHRVLPANRGKMDDCPYCKLPLRDTK